MSLTELLPVVRALPPAEQATLVRTLADELFLTEELGLSKGASLPIWSPLDAHAAAVDIAKLLESDQAKQK